MRVLINIASDKEYAKVMKINKENMYFLIETLAENYGTDIIVELVGEEVYTSPTESIGFIDVRLTIYDDFIE